MARVEIKGAAPGAGAAGADGGPAQTGLAGAGGSTGESVSYVATTLAAATDVDGAVFLLTGGGGAAGGTGGRGGDRAAGAGAGDGGLGGQGGPGGSALVRVADLAMSGSRLNIQFLAQGGLGGRGGAGGLGGYGGYTSTSEKVTASPAGRGGDGQTGGSGGSATALLVHTTLVGGDLYVSVAASAGRGGLGGSGGDGGAGAAGGGGHGGQGGASGSALTEVVNDTLTGNYMRVIASADAGDLGVGSGGSGGQGGAGSVLRVDDQASVTPPGFGGDGGRGGVGRLLFSGNTVSAAPTGYMSFTLELSVSAPTGGAAGYSTTSGLSGAKGLTGAGELRVTDNHITTSSATGGVVTFSLGAYKGADLVFENNVLTGSPTALETLYLNFYSATSISGDPTVLRSLTVDLQSGLLEVDGRANRTTDFDAIVVNDGVTGAVLRGSSGANSLTGSSHPDVLEGRQGDDGLRGRGGDDVLNGGPGYDFLDGGDGSDVAVYTGGRADYALVKGDYDGNFMIADLRADPQDGADRLADIERLRFADGEVPIGSVTPVTIDPRIVTAVSNVLRASYTSLPVLTPAAQATVGLSSGALDLPAAYQLIARAAAGTTSVATLTYEFFTGREPTAAGLDYLVSSSGNANNLTSSYYAAFSTENRYINFAVNLGKLGEGQAKFAAAYGALSLFDATRKAYATVFGSTPTDDKLHQILDTASVLSGGTYSRADYFAYYGADGPNGLGTKAAMVGWLLAEAQKADVGVYAKANDLLLVDLADGAALGVDMVGVYGRPEHVYTGG